MAAGFTTWTALKANLLDDFARNVHARKEYVCGDTTIRFRDFADFQAMLQFVERRAALESARPPAKRTFAAQGGGKC